MIELRAQQIIIDTPKLGVQPFIQVTVQRVVFDNDGAVTQTISRERTINKQLSKVATEVYEYSDPVTQESEHISIAGLANAIERSVRTWILEEYPEAYFKGNRVLIDDNHC